MSYSTRWKKVFGLTDGECMERLWSFLRKFSHITKEMTQSHRIDLLSDALLHYSACKLANLSTFLCVSLQKAKDITKQSESELSRICQEFSVTMNTINSWREEAKALLAKKQKTSKKINLSWKESYVKNLDLYHALCLDLALCEDQDQIMLTNSHSKYIAISAIREQSIIQAEISKLDQGSRSLANMGLKYLLHDKKSYYEQLEENATLQFEQLAVAGYLNIEANELLLSDDDTLED
ncbi:uncharacterized protein [Apostichopus japonicus]|uniref:uncharacterized protein n=1 Tax=Stichopus japonicus TaxID=307972 RepID=UPI003AB2AF9F